eukprot:scaffold87163_cov33-Phaeocystis_antarctica.AAC.1
MARHGKAEQRQDYPFSRYAHGFLVENASSISKPPISFAARPVVAPKALFIGVCICLPWGRGAIS